MDEERAICQEWAEAARAPMSPGDRFSRKDAYVWVDDQEELAHMEIADRHTLAFRILMQGERSWLWKSTGRNWWECLRLDGIPAQKSEINCWYCSALMLAPTKEHVRPKAAGGTLAQENKRLACERCNCVAGDWPLEVKLALREFFQDQGRQRGLSRLDYRRKGWRKRAAVYLLKWSRERELRMVAARLLGRSRS